MEPHANGPWKSLNDKKRAYENATNNARQYQTIAQSQIMDSADYTRLIYRTDVEIWKKFAQALACMLLFFIGAPIGALLKKGGLGTPAIFSMLFFVLYWVIDIIGERLANNGQTTAFVGKFISAFILGPLGAYFTVKAIQDASLLQMDLFKSWFRKFKSKLIRMFRQTRIVYMGTPEFSVGPLQALRKAGYKVVGVVTAPDKPSGRGLKISESAVKKYAVEEGLPLLQPEKLKDEQFLRDLAAWKADLFVVVGFRMLPEVVWKMPKLGTFNLHAALLPQYRGAAPINWAVINGENISGVTTFMIDQKIDTGGIILRGGNLPAEFLRHQLTAVTDAENRHLQRKHVRVRLRSILQIDAVRAPGKDNAERVKATDLLYGHVVRMQFTVNMHFAQTARYELIILPAKIKNEYFFHRSFLQGRGNKPYKQRVRPVWTALKFRMKLHSHKKSFFTQLHGLNNMPVRGQAAQAEPPCLQRLPIVIVEFITVAMPFPDLRNSIAAPHDRILHHTAGICAEPKRAALADFFILVRQKIDHLVKSFRVQFTGSGIRQSTDISGKFDNGYLHPKADTEIGDILFPCIFGCYDHPLNAAVSKAARHNDAVTAGKLLRCRFLRD